MKLKNARILITGAAGGLGQAAGLMLMEKGAHVIGIDLDPSTSALKVIQADLTIPSQRESAVRQAIQALGGLDILINNAGILSLQDAGLPPSPNAEQSMNVNFWAPWHVTSLVLPELLASKGKVINVASLFAVVNAPFIPSYCASKRALSAYSDVLRFQYKNQLSVTTVYPGFINTAIHNGAVRQGLSVETLVTFKPFGIKLLSLEEPLRRATKGLVRACKNSYRDRGTTAMGTLTLITAKLVPSFIDWFIGFRISWLVKRGVLNLNLDEPKAERAMQASI